MTSILDQTHCMGVLEPHLVRIHRAFHNAFQRYQETAPHIKAEHDERAASSGVHSHVYHEFSREFADVTGAHILDLSGLKLLNLSDKIVGRFKKVDEDGRHRNHDSNQQDRFDKQLPLPGLPPSATHVTLGYEPDPAFYEIVRITVGCPLGRNVLPLWLAQVNIVEEQASWVDITPARLPGTERYERYRDDDAASGS